MITLLTILHICVCIFLIGIVLLQHGKGADMGASFGGSGQTVFGTDGPLPLLNKITTGAAIIFMITSVALAYNSAHSSRGSVMKNIRPAQTSPLEQAPIIVPTPGEGDLQRTLTETAPTSAEFPGAPALEEAMPVTETADPPATLPEDETNTGEATQPE